MFVLARALSCIYVRSPCLASPVRPDKDHLEGIALAERNFKITGQYCTRIRKGLGSLTKMRELPR